MPFQIHLVLRIGSGYLCLAITIAPYLHISVGEAPLLDKPVYQT